MKASPFPESFCRTNPSPPKKPALNVLVNAYVYIYGQGGRGGGGRSRIRRRRRESCG